MMSKAKRFSDPLIIVIAGSFVVAASMGIGRFAYTPLLPSMQEALAWSVAQAGDVAAANYAGYMLGAMVASLLVHRPQRRMGLLAGMVFSALTTMAGAWISTYIYWLCLRFFSGFASAFCLVLGTAMVVEMIARQARPQLGSIYFSGVAVGIILSVIMIEIARFAGCSVFMQWGILGAVSFVALTVAWLVLREMADVPASSRLTVNEDVRLSSNRALQRLIAAYGFFGFGYVVTATFIVAIARGLENAVVLEPLTWIVVGLAGIPSLFCWQYLSERIGVIMALRIAYGVEAVGVLLAGIANHAVMVLLGGALLGATFMAITSLGFSAARQIAGVAQDKAIAWMTVSFGLGQFLGPVVAGRMAEVTHSFAAPSVLAATLLVVGLLLIQSESHRVK